MSRRSALASTAVGVLAVPLVVLLAAPASAATPEGGARSGTLTVKAQSDAWYSTSSACTASPTGCLPAGAPAPPYTAKTLHVGVGAGQEESRTYLSLNLLNLPAGTTLTGGTLHLPVGGMAEGSRSADTASLQACLVTASFKDNVEGSTEKPPAIDCKKATAKAKYAAATATAPEEYIVDLTAFASAWSAGSPDYGIALVPAADSAPSDAWHLALSAHDRTGSTVPAPSASVSYASVAANSSDASQWRPTPQAPPADQGFGSSSASFAAPPLAPQSVSVPAAAAPVVQPVAAPQAAPVAPQQITPQAFLGTGRFAYPGVFLLPLVLIAAAGWLGAGVDPRPRHRLSQADSETFVTDDVISVRNARSTSTPRPGPGRHPHAPSSSTNGAVMSWRVVAVGRGRVARKREARQRREGDVGRAADAGLEHAAAPDRDAVGPRTRRGCGAPRGSRRPGRA